MSQQNSKIAFFIIAKFYFVDVSLLNDFFAKTAFRTQCYKKAFGKKYGKCRISP